MPRETGASIRVGVGYDSHRFVAGRPLKLGGVSIPSDLGLAGHSDGDAICHAITDAILGAAGLGDIGEMFPDTDDRFKGVSSLKFLRKTPWARQKVESLYLFMLRERARATRKGQEPR